MISTNLRLNLSTERISTPTRTIATLEEIHKIKKSELHLHLGGSWPVKFLLEIAKKEEYLKLQEFIQQTELGVEYSDLFTVFTLIGKIVNTDEKTKQGAVALCEWLANDNVTYAEIRTGLKDLGNGYESHLLAILEGLGQGCLLWNTTTPLILSLRRNTSITDAISIVKLAIKYRSQGVCGIDISGDSTVGNSKNLIPAIELAQQNNLPIVLHIGESPKECEDQQVWELENIKPWRIGHAVLLGYEAKNYVLKHKVPIEMCLRSSEIANMTTKAENHPAIKLLEEGHPVCICTDDPSVFKTSLSDEFHRTAQILKLSVAQLQQIENNTQVMRLVK